MWLCCRHDTYFYKVFKVYTQLWKFQQENRQKLIEAGLRRWEIGEIASRIGQLYFGQYMGTALDPSEGQLNDRVAVKDGEFGELSPEIRTTVDETSHRAGMHPRRSSWGRKSGSWEMSPEVLALAAKVGESNRMGGGSSSLTTENRHT